LLLAGVACGGDATAPACSGAVEVPVSGGLPPAITWRPNCGVDRLSALAPPSTGFVLYWSISAGERQIEPGVRYGRVPPGAVEDSPPIALSSGSTVAITVEAPRGTTVGSTAWLVP
jgi:hypothetical protein